MQSAVFSFQSVSSVLCSVQWSIRSVPRTLQCAVCSVQCAVQCLLHSTVTAPVSPLTIQFTEPISMCMQMPEFPKHRTSKYQLHCTTYIDLHCHVLEQCILLIYKLCS